MIIATNRLELKIYCYLSLLCMFKLANKLKFWLKIKTKQIFSVCFGFLYFSDYAGSWCDFPCHFIDPKPLFNLFIYIKIDTIYSSPSHSCETIANAGIKAPVCDTLSAYHSKTGAWQRKRFNMNCRSTCTNTLQHENEVMMPLLLLLAFICALPHAV